MNNSASQQGQNRQANRNTAGDRRRNRDVQRQNDFLLNRDWNRNRDWNSQIELEASLETRRQQQIPVNRQARNKNRAQQWKKQAKGEPKKEEMDLSKFKTTVETPPKNEPLYDLVAGSRPVRRLYSQNCDFSGFPLLCETVHRDLKQSNPRIKRELPYCAFLHSMTTCLNAWLINNVTKVNLEDRYSDESDSLSLIPNEMLIPQPIAEYLSMINTVITPSGDTIRVNVPDSCVPQHNIPAEEGKEAIPPGSFGDADAQNHNTYECYVSPYVTSRFVEASVEEAAEYSPLPAGRYPANSTPTRNRLHLRNYGDLSLHPVA